MPERTGSFVYRDHGTSGMATIYRFDDGRRVLRIEDLDTSNGPALFVYLSANPAAGPEGAFDDTYVNLGSLKGNVGDQNYEVPAGVKRGELHVRRHLVRPLRRRLRRRRPFLTQRGPTAMSTTPIGDHALLSDCRSTAVVDRSGSVEWLCWPRLDAPSVFGRLLRSDRRSPVDRPVSDSTVERRYVDRTMVLETTFTTARVRSPSPTPSPRDRASGATSSVIARRVCSYVASRRRPEPSTSRWSSSPGRSTAW